VIGLKSKIALLLSILLLVTLLIPAQSFAAEDDQGLEAAIKAVKSKIDIPEGYKLSSSFSMENGVKVWSLNWNSEDELEGSVYVRVNEKGTILSYNVYKPFDYDVRKLPKVSSQQAKVNADNFINKVNPELLESLMYIDNLQTSLMDYAYYFEYVRLVNDVPYYNNNVNIGVNRDTGEVIRYYYNWTDDLDFPSLEGKIELDKAQKAYKENMGLELVYMNSVETDGLKIFAAYVPKYDNYSYAIDAFTGERFKLNERYEVYFNDQAMTAENEMLKMAAGDTGGGVTLTPEEQKEVERIMKLKPLDEIEKIVRGISALNLASDMKLAYYNLSQNWIEKDKYEYYLRFSNEETAKDNKINFATVTVDAVTGKIKSFYSYTRFEEDKKPVDDEESARAAVERFLKEFVPDEFSQTEFDEEVWSNYLRYAGTEPLREYNFYYARKVNGITCRGNGISVGYDAVNQKICSFNIEWFNKEFPSIEGVAKLDDVYEVVFGQVGLELQYKPTYPENRDTERIIIPDYNSIKPEIKLVYVLKSNKPLIFDGFTGAILDYSGKPYKEAKPVEYTDIDDSFAKNQIMALAEYGIYLEGTEFRPNEKITQLDFLYLLSKTIGYYYGPIITKDSSSSDIDSLYNHLIREGIITKDEKNPESTVKREDAVKYIIKAMKYGEVAEIKDIFNCTFKDKDKISTDLIGYVTIAHGFKIVGGSNGYFNPQNELTRAEAAVMVYNYLAR
jgi:hypothetical protein